MFCHELAIEPFQSTADLNEVRIDPALRVLPKATRAEVALIFRTLLRTQD